MAIEKIAIKDLERETLQTRVALSADTVEDYADAMRGKAKFPPVTVFADAERLFRLSGMPMPAQLAGLRGREERFTDVCDLAEMPAKVLECAK